MQSSINIPITGLHHSKILAAQELLDQIQAEAHALEIFIEKKLEDKKEKRYRERLSNLLFLLSSASLLTTVGTKLFTNCMDQDLPNNMCEDMTNTTACIALISYLLSKILKISADDVPIFIQMKLKLFSDDDLARLNQFSAKLHSLTTAVQAAYGNTSIFDLAMTSLHSVSQQLLDIGSLNNRKIKASLMTIPSIAHHLSTLFKGTQRPTTKEDHAIRPCSQIKASR